MKCVKCDAEYNPKDRRGKGGKITECNDCAEETVVKYTGNVIYDHKTTAMVQINRDPALTAYINNATKLQCKGSNLGNNLKVNSKLHKSNGACMYVADRLNYKGRV